LKRKFSCKWSKAQEYLSLPGKETQTEKIEGESLKQTGYF
jgi:hypothetical protein